MLMFCYNVNTPKRKERCYVIFIRKSEKVPCTEKSYAGGHCGVSGRYAAERVKMGALSLTYLRRPS